MLRGSLRHRIAIYRPDVTDRGNMVISWQKIGEVKASIKVMESFEGTGQDLQGVEVIEITLPFSKALDLNYADMILVHRGHEFEVIAPPTNVDYNDKVLKILAKKYEFAPRVT